MNRCAIVLLVITLLVGGCTYKARVSAPTIVASETRTPGTSTFAVARFEDRHPARPLIGRVIQHCIMRYIIVFGPIRHKAAVPPERLLPETLGAFMRERGYNVMHLDRVMAAGARPPAGADYLLTGTIHEFYFSTPSADFVPAKIKVEWTAVITDRNGREVFHRRVGHADKKLLGFGTNSFLNTEPFVRKAVYRSVERFLESPELKQLIWRPSKASK